MDLPEETSVFFLSIQMDDNELINCIDNLIPLQTWKLRDIQHFLLFGWSFLACKVEWVHLAAIELSQDLLHIWFQQRAKLLK